jgi:hypothetical protein
MRCLLNAHEYSEKGNRSKRGNWCSSVPILSQPGSGQVKLKLDTSEYSAYGHSHSEQDLYIISSILLTSNSPTTTTVFSIFRNCYHKIMDAFVAQAHELGRSVDDKGRQKMLDTLRDLQSSLETPYDTMERLARLVCLSQFNSLEKPHLIIRRAEHSTSCDQFSNQPWDLQRSISQLQSFDHCNIGRQSRRCSRPAW